MAEVFDRHELLEELDGDREFLEETVAILNEDAPELLGRIREAVALNDPQAAASSAHTLKSMVGNFCAGPAHEAALTVETHGRSGDLPSCRTGLITLEKEVHCLQRALREFLNETAPTSD